MTIEKVRNILNNKAVSSAILVGALALMVGVVSFNRSVPDFPEIVDPVTEVTLEEEETPLAQPTITKKTTQKTSTSKKNVKLKEKSTKTYTKNLGTKTTKSSKTTKESNVTTKTDIVVKTSTSEKYKKNKNVKTVTTKVTTTTTVTTTVQPVVVATQGGSSTTAQTVSTSLADNASAGSSAPAAAAPQTAAAAPSGTSTVSVDSLAPMMNSNVLNAYNSLNFKVKIDPSVSYSGYFEARNQSITLKKADQTIYHELGHFIAFAAGNVDKSSGFMDIYNNSGEVASFPGINKTYASQNASEFFAECVRLYILEPSNLASACPKTYAAIETAISKITDAQVLKMKKVYAAYWTF